MYGSPPLEEGGIYASLAQFGRASDFYPNQFNWFGKWSEGRGFEPRTRLLLVLSTFISI